MVYLKGFGKYPKEPQLHEKTLATKKTYKFPKNKGITSISTYTHAKELEPHQISIELIFSIQKTVLHSIGLICAD